MTKLALFASILAGLAGCGGCPWTKTSAPTVAPATSCLTLSVADSSGTPPSTGCVNPVLYGTNGCSASLTLPPATASSDAPVVVPASAHFTYEIPERAIHARSVSLDATVGATPITIAFSVSGGSL